jgi:ADP-ribose pyrophosphatase YjhB (NUDIX family)
MADEKRRRKRQESSDEDPTSNEQGERPRGGASGGDLARSARRELGEITGLEAEAVTSLERVEDGTWMVTVELLELSRVPETDDILGSYEAQLNEDGELLGYRRLRRYARSQAQQEQAVGGS